MLRLRNAKVATAVHLFLALLLLSAWSAAALRPNDESEEPTNKLKTDAATNIDDSGTGLGPGKPLGLRERVEQDPNGYLHIGISVCMLAIAVVLPCTSKPIPKEEACEREGNGEKLADVAAGLSEDEDEDDLLEDEQLVEGARKNGKAEATSKNKLKSGLAMSFTNPEIEQEWDRDSHPKNMRRGAVLMSGAAVGMILDRVYHLWEIKTCTGHLVNRRWMDIASLFVLVKVFIASMYCSFAKAPNRFVYWVLVVFFSVFFVLVTLPPLTPSCLDLESMKDACPADQGSDAAPFLIAWVKKDCTLQGHTACQICQLFLLILPYILPQFRQVHLAFLWLALAYVGTSCFYLWYHKDEKEETVHESDIELHTFLLLLSLCVSCAKKYFLEKGMRKQFVDDHAQKEASRKLYNIFRDMVPEHVIPRMLKNETIADPVDRVTVLFIVIADFDRFSSRMSPKELLKFLNQYFSKMDTICQENKVTKIETVAEEYVACVGVMPEDEGTPHSQLLPRLFKAADQILDLQAEDVKFKMGAHSGPIVAGVIGQKLPRFRLFGDTINTSARMMQKGIPGTLQFGEETRKDVPDSIPIKQRGEVMMKGKGNVMAYMFDREANKKASSSKQELAVPEATARTSVTSMMLTNQPEQSEVKASEQAELDKVDKMIAEIFVEKEAKRFILSQAEGFSDEVPLPPNMASEAEWSLWFHHTTVCRKFLLRINQQAVLLAVVTAADVLHMEHVEAWCRPDKATGFLNMAVGNDTLKYHDGRFTVYLVCRVVCMLFILVWSFAARTAWMKESPRSVQLGLTLSNTIVLGLLFISYDAVVIPQITRLFTELPRVDVFNQQMSLVFVLGFFMVANTHPILFHYSLATVVAAILFMHFRDRTSLYISNIGRVVFLCTAVLSTLLAHEGEQTSRARFKSRQKIADTQVRIEKTLNNLMPPMVLQELRSRPEVSEELPAHPYRNATITQSDLCGFTALASTAKPYEVVRFMGDLFGRFDELSDVYGVYKVETVGDAYIAGMAEGPLTYKNSPVAVVQFGMAMIEATAAWASSLGVNVKCRVGVHHGECMGGIVGTGMMRYHLFGEFMGAVDTLEATSREGVAQISKACKAAMEQYLKDEGEGRTLESIFPGLVARADEKLTTSKGEVHEYSEVGGATFLVYTSKDTAQESSKAAAPSVHSPAPKAAAAPVAAPAHAPGDAVSPVFSGPEKQEVREEEQEAEGDVEKEVDKEEPAEGEDKQE